MGKYISIIVAFFIVLSSLILLTFKAAAPVVSPIGTTQPWEFQAIDTMKFSRDLSREKLNDELFIKTIDEQVKNIADTGATHVGIATPYDDEFLPILKQWVISARKHNLKVWFRGNFSGWEGWFDYPSITREQHIQMTEDFITQNADIFEDGDVFSACPECENGGPGDPRKIGKINEYRKFLIDEYVVTKRSFAQINRNVASNYLSMNADVAKLIMDKKTTSAVDGVVTIDHYVPTSSQMVSDIRFIADKSGGKIVMGEFGAPIPDINGAMSEDEQAAWIDDVLGKLVNEPDVIGVSYWVNVGGSTELWTEKGRKKKAVDILTNYFKGYSKADR